MQLRPLLWVGPESEPEGLEVRDGHTGLGTSLMSGQSRNWCQVSSIDCKLVQLRFMLSSP